MMLFLLPIYFLKDAKEPRQQVQETTNTNTCQLFIKVNGVEIEIDDYLIGVLAGEMPASFHEEALKAQAIAARTYVLKKMNQGEKEILSTTAHQVYQDKKLRQEKWQAAFATNEENLAQAVRQTEDQVITYNGELITAMFHSSSNQTTESAKNYSGNNIPYLQAVSSPEENTAQQTNFTFTELNALLKKNYTAKQYKNVQIKRNDTNHVEQITIHNKKWSGREIRELLNLRSTNFTWQATAKGVTITTYGYGHGVGMSQNGANTMAGQGSTAQQILAHYYPNTTLKKVNYCEK